MKKVAKNFVATVLGWQIRRLRKKNSFQVIAVAGSVGKTSAKLAIARVLSQKFKVRYQDGNYNDLVSVPLIYFNRRLPRLYNPFAWTAVFFRNELSLRRKYPYDVVVVELGTNAPGHIKEFGKYLSADLGVVTAVAPEHMEFFDDLAAVAKEELAVADFSALTLVNGDMVDSKDLGQLSVLKYGLEDKSDFQFKDVSFKDKDCEFSFVTGGKKIFSARMQVLSRPSLYVLLAACAAGTELGMSGAELKEGLANIIPVPGRMQLLQGINNSLIIDDTYNASPEAVKAALETLYRLKAPQKIALLGNMNELGKFSEEAHREIGRLCDPKKLDLVITLGPDANKYTAPEALKRGCKVQEFHNPYLAGEYLKSQIEQGTLILAKGSQDKVFAEEALKAILADPQDAKKLVRQNRRWLKYKKQLYL